MRHPSLISNARGFSLVETLVAAGVLSVGLLGVAGVFARGARHVGNSPLDLIATQKAAEAIESVYTARDGRTQTWPSIRNVKGATGSDGGIFLDGPQPLKDPGPDGFVNTADDGAVQRIVRPGPDNLLNTPDDEVFTLDMFTREVEIRDVSTNVRQIRVIVRYQNGPELREFILVTYISSYA
jgi:type II secretory pathway pseudopilin PulG